MNWYEAKYCPGCDDDMLLEHVNTDGDYSTFYCSCCNHYTTYFKNQSEFYARTEVDGKEVQ